MDFHDSVKKFFFKTSKLNYFCPQINEFENQDDSEVLSSDFLGLRNLWSLIDLSSLCNLTGLNSPISSKNFLILMVWSSMASKWLIPVLFVEWIIKNPNFYWYMVPSLLEAFEASLCKFSENWLMKLKFFNLRYLQTKSCIFLSESIYKTHFAMVDPVSVHIPHTAKHYRFTDDIRQCQSYHHSL